MLFRLFILWFYLMAISIHAVKAGGLAMANDIEGMAKVTYTEGKVYSVVTDKLGTPTEAYNTESEEVWLCGLNMNGISPVMKEKVAALQNIR